MMKSIVIIGAGASGLMAAISAARAGARVTILEAMEKPGKKLLMTGNGHCNLTNLDFNRKDCYRGEDSSYWKQAYAEFNEKKTMAFFEEIGLLLQTRGNGVYPLTDQAASVLDCLLLEIQRLSVKLKCQEKVVRIEKKQNSWKVYTQSWHYDADAVILACGSRAVSQTGSDGSGYTLAEMAGHRIVEPFPALVPLKCREGFVRKLAGLRTKAEITMYISDATGQQQNCFWESGELQWTEYGISGILVFQLSRYASCALKQKQNVRVAIDCLPSVAEEQLFSIINNRIKKENISNALTGILPKKMIPVMLELAQIKKASAHPEEEKIRELSHIIKHLSLSVSGTRSFEQAQVCAGGVTTGEIDPVTMESRRSSGLYITGELLDIDGICGGYNLQWAWTTGYLAGIHSAGKEEDHD